MYLHPTSTGANRLFKTLSPSMERVTVDTVTLDHLLRDNRAFDVIKIDIEGAEMAAFSGMSSVIERSHNLSISMEFTPGMYQKTGLDPQDFLRKMLKLGFIFWEIDERNGGIVCLNQNDVTNLCDKPQSNLFLDRYENSESLIQPLVIQRK